MLAELLSFSQHVLSLIDLSMLRRRHYTDPPVPCTHPSPWLFSRIIPVHSECEAKWLFRILSQAPGALVRAAMEDWWWFGMSILLTGRWPQCCDFTQSQDRPVWVSGYVTAVARLQCTSGEGHLPRGSEQLWRMVAPPIDVTVEHQSHRPPLFTSL